MGNEAYRWGRSYTAHLIGGPLDGNCHGFALPPGSVVAPPLIVLAVTWPPEWDREPEKLRYERIRVDPDDPTIGFYQLMKQ